MTETAAPLLQWINNGIVRHTIMDKDNRRFVITREPSPFLTPRFMLEQIQFFPRSRTKRTILRQLRGIKDVQEAMRIAQEDWS